MGRTLDALTQAERRRRRSADGDRGEPAGSGPQILERLEIIERRLSALDEDLSKRGAETEGRLLHMMESRLGEVEPRLVREIRREFESALSWNLAPVQRRVTRSSRGWSGRSGGNSRVRSPGTSPRCSAA
jgi:hypothetical protein